MLLFLYFPSPGRSDTESAEVKQPITKTQRLKILFGRKRAELGDDAAGGGEEIVDNELVPSHPHNKSAADDDDHAGAPEDYATVDPAAPKRQPTAATKVCYVCGQLCRFLWSCFP